MTVRNLEHLFKPASVAVIGASDRPHSLGARVLRNLMTGGFLGTVYPVNPKHIFVAGSRAYADVGALPETPELAVICTSAQTERFLSAARDALDVEQWDAAQSKLDEENRPRGHGLRIREARPQYRGNRATLTRLDQIRPTHR